MIVKKALVTFGFAYACVGTVLGLVAYVLGLQATSPFLPRSRAVSLSLFLVHLAAIACHHRENPQPVIALTKVRHQLVLVTLAAMTMFVIGTFVWFGLVSQFGKANDAIALPIAFRAAVSAYVYTTAWLAVSYGFGLSNVKWPWTRRWP